MSETNLRPDLDDLRREMRNLGDHHRHAAQTFTNAVETHGGVQILYLDMAVAEMNPAPTQVESDADEHAWMDHTFRRVAGGMHVIEDAAAGRTISGTAQQTLDFHINRLKPAAVNVYEAVRMKVATAAAPPAPEPDYGQRLKAWTLSPGYALIGSPCLSGLITQAAMGESKGLVLFVVLAVVAALVPPALRPLPVITYTRVSVTFIIGASASVVVALIAGGLGVAFLVFALVVLAFLAGRHTQA